MHSVKISGLSRGNSLLPWGIRRTTRPALILAYFMISGINSFNLSGLRINTRYLPSKTFTPRMTSIDGLATVTQEIIDRKTDISSVTTSGLIDYIGNTMPADKNAPRWSNNRMIFKPATPRQLFLTRIKLWQQLPWKKIKGKTILKVKITGDLALDPASGFGGFSSFGSTPDYELISSLTDATTLFNYAAYDPRVTGILLDIGSLSCGYAKLNELRRLIDYFQQSGKEVIGYSAAASEKEFFIGLACSEYYVPPDGGLDLRGFSSAAAFVRGVLDKVGIEPQVQRIGKYKSAGDSLNRTYLSDAQREVISSLIQEGSDYWVDIIIKSLQKQATPPTSTLTNSPPIPTTNNTSTADVSENTLPNLEQTSASANLLATKTKNDIINELWESDKAKSPYDYKTMGYITGVLYLDQIEQMIKLRNLAPLKTNWFISLFLKLFPSLDAVSSPTPTPADFNLNEDTQRFPRRTVLPSVATPANTPAIATNEFGDLPSTTTATTITTTTPSTTSSSSSSSESEESEKQAAAAAAAAETDKKKEKEEKLTAAKQKHEKELLDARKPSIMAAKQYLRKMRKGSYILKGLTFKETSRGARIAIINASGAISSGKSGSSGVSGNTLGSDTFIELCQKARADSSIKAVVLRIDSPGGSALASDLMWREIRLLSREKPVIGSMVDVAASGGYYMAMACDQIVAEDMSITGSIGVVTAKFNAQELFQKIGYGVEVLSKGKFAEVLSTTRGFTEDEEKYFARFAEQAYDSFVTKAASSRSMPKEQMQEVAQGRVWTGRQGLQRGLVDHIGGLAVALQLAASLADLPVTSCLNVQTLTNERRGLAGILGGGASLSTGTTSSDMSGRVMTLTDDALASCGFASLETMGVGPAIANLGISPSIAFALSHNPACRQFLNFLLTSKSSPSLELATSNVDILEYTKFALEDFIDSLMII